MGRELASGGVASADLITTALRAFLSLVVIILALDQILIDTAIIYTFLTPIAWGLGVGLALAVGIGLGWGLQGCGIGLSTGKEACC